MQKGQAELIVLIRTMDGRETRHIYNVDPSLPIDDITTQIFDPVVDKVAQAILHASSTLQMEHPSAVYRSDQISSFVIEVKGPMPASVAEGVPKRIRNLSEPRACSAG